VCDGAPFFGVGCGDIQLRCFEADGRERWRFRYNEGLPGRVRVADVDGSGRPRILVAGDILSDTSACRILDPDGRLLADLGVEGWTSVMTALAFGEMSDRRFIACGANRGRNLHLFEVVRSTEQPETFSCNRLWFKQLGGRVTGIRLLESEGALHVATSRGFALSYGLDGESQWHRLFPRGIDHLAQVDGETLVCDTVGELSLLDESGGLRPFAHLPGACAQLIAAPAGLYAACGPALLRLR
jgi:hypothetical protein